MNELVMPTYKLKAFLALSKGRHTTTRAGLPYAAATVNRLLLVDVSGSRVRFAHTNQMWFVSHTTYQDEMHPRGLRAIDGHYNLDMDKLKQLDISLRNKETALDLDGLRATFVDEDYLKGLDFSILTERNSKGDVATASTFDVGLLQAVTRFFKDVHCPNVKVIYPERSSTPIQWDYGAGEYQGLLMPIRS